MVNHLKSAALTAPGALERNACISYRMLNIAFAHRFGRPEELFRAYRGHAQRHAERRSDYRTRQHNYPILPFPNISALVGSAFLRQSSGS